jgi:hypothetical protein
MICAAQSIIFIVSNQRETDGWGMWHVWEAIEMHTGLWWRDIKEGNHLGRPRRRWNDNIKIELILCFYVHSLDISKTNQPFVV